MKAVISSHSEAETEAAARRLSTSLPERCTVLLSGDLGVGKTVFARGLLRARGVEGFVQSPSFQIVRTYEMDGGQHAHHVDLYRLSGSADEMWEMGIIDTLQNGDLVIVEWPERGKLPQTIENAWTVRIDWMGTCDRRITIFGPGERGVR